MLQGNPRVPTQIVYLNFGERLKDKSGANVRGGIHTCKCDDRNTQGHRDLAGRVIRHTSHVTHHTSYATRHTSHMACRALPALMKTGGSSARRPRKTTLCETAACQIKCHTSHIIEYVTYKPHVSRLTPSHLTPHTLHLTPHTSHLTPHTSHLTPYTSHLTLQRPSASSLPCSCRMACRDRRQ
jgi:hypothetical protein